MNVFRKLVSFTIALYGIVFLFITLFPGLASFIMPIEPLMYFAELILPISFIVYFCINSANKIACIFCAVSLIFILISIIIGITNPTESLLSGNFSQFISYMNRARISANFMNLGTALLGAALFIKSFYENNNKPLKNIYKFGAGFSVYFLILTFIKTANLPSDIILRILSSLVFLWYIYLIIFAFFTFFRKDVHKEK